MKQYFISILIITVFTLQTFSQTKTGHAVDFYTTHVENLKIKKHSLSVNYVTIEKNISVQIPSDTPKHIPTLEEYIQFARSFPSYHFYVINKSDTLFSIIYLQRNEGNKSTFNYEITDLRSNQKQMVQSNIWGEITEKRVDEMMLEKYDPESKKGTIVGTNPRQFFFNNMIYGYQDYEKVKNEVKALVKQLIKS